MQPSWVETLRDVPDIGDSPSALLGALVSCPPLAPYGLIRQARRAVFGAGTLYLEAELCDSELVEAVSKDGVELGHAFRAVAQSALRERVISERIPVDELRAANRCEHLEMSPLLALEEQLIWAYVSQDDPLPECDRLFADCLLSIVRENRQLILDWAAGALRRMPELVLKSQAAWLLSELCAALHRETRRLPPPPAEQIEPGLLQEVLPFLPSALVGFHRDGESLSLGPITRKRRTAFAIPGIAFRPVTVIWTDAAPQDEESAKPVPGPNLGRETHSPDRDHELTVDLTEPVHLIPVGASAVRLRTASGAVISLPSFQPDAKAPELVELDRWLDHLEDAWRNARSVTATVVRTVSPSGAIVRFVEARGVSGYLRLERSFLEETGINPWSMAGSLIEVRISSFERAYQRILCRPAPPPVWSAGMLEPEMEVEGRVENAVTFGYFVTVPTTERGFDGPTIRGLLHNSEVPQWWLKRVGVPQKGQPLQLRVLTIDQERNRVSLGVADDIAAVLSLLPQGKVLTGVVGKIVPYGVFVEIMPGFDALLHNSEIAQDTDLAEGGEILVRVIDVDLERSRISLATEPRIAEGTPSRPLTVVQAVKKTPPQAVTNPAPPPKQAVHRPVGLPNDADVAEFLRQRLRQLKGPITLVRLAVDVKTRFGPAIGTNWQGYGAFKRMLLGLVPEATVDKNPPGHVYPL